ASGLERFSRDGIRIKRIEVARRLHPILGLDPTLFFGALVATAACAENKKAEALLLPSVFVLLLNGVGIFFIKIPLLLYSYSAEILHFMNQVYSVPVVVVFAIALFKLRCSALIWYARFEIAIAVVTIYYDAILQRESLLAKIILMSAAIYIFIRGMSNLDESL